MLSSVKEVEYYYTVVADKPGEARKLLDFLSEKMVGLLALTAFPLGEGKSQIDLFPEDVGAYSNLAVLYALSGRGPEVGGVLRRMVEANDSAAAYAEAVRTLRVLEDRAAAAALLRFARGRFPGSEELRGLETG